MVTAAAAQMYNQLDDRRVLCTALENLLLDVWESRQDVRTHRINAVSVLRGLLLSLCSL